MPSRRTKLMNRSIASTSSADKPPDGRRAAALRVARLVVLAGIGASCIRFGQSVQIKMNAMDKIILRRKNRSRDALRESIKLKLGVILSGVPPWKSGGGTQSKDLQLFLWAQAVGEAARIPAAAFPEEKAGDPSTALRPPFHLRSAQDDTLLCTPSLLPAPVRVGSNARSHRPHDLDHRPSL